MGSRAAGRVRSHSWSNQKGVNENAEDTKKNQEQEAGQNAGFEACEGGEEKWQD